MKTQVLTLIGAGVMTLITGCDLFQESSSSTPESSRSEENNDAKESSHWEEQLKSSLEAERWRAADIRTKQIML